MGAAQRLDQRVTVETEPHVDLVAGYAQTVEARLGDFFGDEYAWHPSMLACARCPSQHRSARIIVTGCAPRFTIRQHHHSEA